MTVKERMQDSLIRYPLTNHNRIAVYMQWFLVGTAVWKRGELFERGEYPKRPMTMQEGYVVILQEAIRKVKTKDPLYNSLLPITHPVTESAIQAVLHWSWAAEQPLQLAPNQNVRWISSDCALLNLPKNITADWQDAVDEMKAWLLENFDLFEENDKKLIDEITRKIG